MVPLNIILYSLRAVGYVYNNGAYGSQAAEARLFTEAEAVEYAKRHVTHEGASVMLPVNIELLNEIQGSSR